MKATEEHNERMATMTFASVYPHYITKVVSKGRTKDELHQVIKWLTNFDEKKIQELIDDKVTFETFFKKAKLNPNASLITGVICGYRIEELENPLNTTSQIFRQISRRAGERQNDGEDFAKSKVTHYRAKEAYVIPNIFYIGFKAY